MAEKKTTQAEALAAKPVPMTHESRLANDTLSIGDSVYEVIAGHVEVAPEHVEAATAAGFRLG